jgi:hypothetical protein
LLKSPVQKAQEAAMSALATGNIKEVIRCCPTTATGAQHPVSQADLSAESDMHRGSGGCSEENAGLGFRPAFLDADTGSVYRSCFPDGTPAPFHLLDGLPDAVIVSRTVSGRVAEAKASLVSGFVRLGRFYTRDEAAAAVQDTTPKAA